ncbi:MAG: 4-alpha-glucanotransferase, partial [Vicinamibacterales bacterium]
RGARRRAALYDGYRVDHLVGFYRTYSRSRSESAEPEFSPSTEPEQQRLGERVLQLFRDAGAEIVAEDLGTVPDFVRMSLADMRVPGFRVFRWEREWEAEGQPFRDPADYPPVSVATTGTHDTEPLAAWWNTASEEEHAAVAALPTVARLACGTDLLHTAYEPRVREVLLEALVASGSDIVLFPIQDVFGWTERINEPATVSSANWTYRLPWAIDRLESQPQAAQCRDALRRWCQQYGRTKER